MSNKVEEKKVKPTAKPVLMPKLRFPEFRGEGEWEVTELGLLTTKVGSGITPTGGDKNYKAEGRPFVRSQNVGWGELILNDVAFIDEETHRSFKSSEIKVSDVLLNITGASIGRSVVADSRIAGGNVNQHVCIIRVKQDELNPALLNHFLVSERGQKQIDSFQAGGNRQGLNFAQIRSFEIPLPSTVNEQSRIADCLSSIDELLTFEAQKLDTLKTHKKGLMQQLFPAEGNTVPQLRFPEFRDAGEWKERQLSKLTTKISDGIHTTPVYEENGEYAFINGNNLVNGRIVIDEKTKRVNSYEFNKHRKPLDANSILISINGTIGNLAFFRGEHVILGKSACFINIDSKLANKFFIYFQIQTNKVKCAFTSELTGSTIKNLSLRTIKNIELLVPTFPEQKKIVSCLSSLDDLIIAQTQKINVLKAHKKGLMQQLFPSFDEART
ncbi:MAG: restriction endonuclease subunit S [Candidatus Electrothrix sp. AX5]|nr:restriction endonuclease subunit S [Candidatus Electrothrix sp. AX5]